MRHRGRTDSTHKAVVEALRAAGCTVVSLANVGSSIPDLLVGVNGRNVLLEVKSERARVKQGKVENATRERQESWAARWRGGPVWRVETPLEALLACSLTKEARPCQ